MHICFQGKDSPTFFFVSSSFTVSMCLFGDDNKPLHLSQKCFHSGLVVFNSRPCINFIYLFYFWDFFNVVSRFSVSASAEAFICWVIASSDVGTFIFMQWGEKRIGDDTPFEHQGNHGTGLGRKSLCTHLQTFILFSTVSQKKKKEKL